MNYLEIPKETKKQLVRCMIVDPQMEEKALKPSRKCILWFLVLLAGSMVKINAQPAVEGALTADMIEQIRQSFEMDASTKALMNALTNNDIKKLAVNREKYVTFDNLFNHKIKTKGITNQKSSGRCWLFAALNVMRPQVIEKYKLEEFEFSQSYLFFWDKFEKANLFLELIIEMRDRDHLDRELQMILESPFPDGGLWIYAVELIEKYGAVPKSIMPESEQTSNTGMMDKLISHKLRKDASVLREMNRQGSTVAELRTRKVEMLKDVYKMLVLNMGVPPTSFRWRYESKDSTVSEIKTYTPQSFFKEVVKLNLRDYVPIYNHPLRPYDKLYQMRLNRNIYDRPDNIFLNLDTQRMRELALKQILNNQPVYFACDVGQEDNYEFGIMSPQIYDYDSFYGLDFSMSKEDKFRYRESHSTHAMVFVGVDTLNGKPQKWLVENSWGDERGDEGFWSMHDDWFDQYVYKVIINKKYLPKQILETLKTEPEVIPPWDPM
jgi:bleomycin hydrolase